MPKAATTDLNAEALPRTKRREDAKPGRFQARISERQRELFQRAARSRTLSWHMRRKQPNTLLSASRSWF